MSENRIGILCISRELFLSDWESANSSWLKDFVIVDVTWHFPGVGKFVAYSKYFDVVPDGEIIPEYVLELETIKIGAASVTQLRSVKKSQK